ncbi:MAG TPA: alpha/beta fold hydrolase [Woeseiaceae bacterium]|nr:alpha/beta fold hydrolase [Woeseiaceae bacterium]
MPRAGVMAKPPHSNAFFIDGAAGRLEALLETPDDAAVRGCALVCHPHPQHGGSLHNKVVHTLARAFQHRHMRTLRFNFRGVGSSDGEFDNAHGELDDAVTALAYLRAHWPDDPLWVAGFSFGAAVAIRVALREQVAGLVSVAPAVRRFAGDVGTLPACPWLVVHGGADEVVSVDETIAWLNELPPGPELEVFPDTGHFFHGKLVELRQAVEYFIAAQPGE